MFVDTYREELEYLRELGRAMAREYPVLEPFLNAPEGDEAIERILEGTAFLTAGLRRKLDDDIPELTHPILQALAPSLMRPGPATSILEFRPLGQLVTEPHVIPAGTEVDSREVEGVSCRFRSAWDVTLLPLELVEARVDGDLGATPELRLRFEIASGVKPEDLRLDRLRLHLCGEPAQRSALYAYLCDAVAGVRIQVPGAGAEGSRLLSPDALRPAGFGLGEGLWADTPGQLVAYRLLQEFFSFPEKFSFVDVEGIGSLALLGEAREFELIVRFARPRSSELSADLGNFLLHCTPIVNLFTRKSAPIPLVSGRSEFRVEPVDAEEGKVEVYAVERIEGWTRGAVERVEFSRFDSLDPSGGEDGEAWFRTRTAASVLERRVDTWVSFVDSRQQVARLDADTAIAELWCTNGDLPAQLAVGDVDRATINTPPIARFRNVSGVAPGAMPPIDADLPWRLLAQFSLNRHSLASAESLRWVIASFDLRGLRDRQARRATERLLDGLVSVETDTEDVFHRGVPARGTRVRIVLDPECFDGPGEIALFIRILDELLPLYATANATLRLVVETRDGSERWERPARPGTQPIV